jgi:uncharacterized membrane protein YeaQ/YmgE (transglycosylase-associated protein family)
MKKLLFGFLGTIITGLVGVFISGTHNKDKPRRKK